MKGIITNYTFNPNTDQVTIAGLDEFNVNRLMAIINQTDNEIIYAVGVDGKGFSAIAGNVVTLQYDCAGMNALDELVIIYAGEVAADGGIAIAGYESVGGKMLIGNVQGKFRDGFAEPGTQPDPAAWDVSNDNDDHLINAGGNAAGSSYLRISMNPWKEGSEVELLSKVTFTMPFRVAFGASLSQRIVGQEIFVGFVAVDDNGDVVMDTPIADKAITGATATIASNVGTFTITDHGLKGGDRVNIFGCAEHRLNVGPVLVTVLTKDTFTVPVTLANGSYSTTGGFVRFSDPFRGASNGTAYLFENATVTQATLATKRNGSKARMLTGQTVPTTVAVQTNTSPISDAFNAAGIYELFAQLEEVGFRGTPADSVATPSGLVKFAQTLPDENYKYKMLIRARNLTGISRPIAKITGIAKTGTTTATVTTGTPHGLAVGDYVQIYGVLDQTNFPNLTAQTVVASVPDSTSFTIVIGTASTTSSSGGVVIRNEGSVLAPGIIAQAVQSVSRTGGIMTLIGSGTWATPLPGEYMEVAGMTGGAAQYDGPYKVLRVSTTTLELEAPGADFGSIATGGAVMRRTDVRMHFARMLDYTRLVAEIIGGRGNTTDINNSVPVSITNQPATTGVTQANGGGNAQAAAQWSVGQRSGVLVADVASAALTTTTTTSAVTPGALANIGVLSQSFNIVVTAVSGTTPTLDVGVEESMDGGTNWVRIFDFPRITTAGAYFSPLIRTQWGTRIRYVQTVAGTTPSFTRAVNRLENNAGAPIVRQFIDRSIAVTTLNSVTPTYDVDGCDRLQLTVNMGTITTTAPQFQLEGSDDNGASWYAIDTPLTGVTVATVVKNYTGVMPKKVRARISTAGVAATLGSVQIKGLGM